MNKKSPLFLSLLVLLICACGQVQTKLPKEQMDKFEAFKKKEKFNPDTTIFYPGIADASLKPILTEKINLAANDFQKLASGKANERDYQTTIAIGLDRFTTIYSDLDTEDRERICHYFEELMDIVGLQSSGGQLNHFMYGFDPTKK